MAPPLKHHRPGKGAVYAQRLSGRAFRFRCDERDTTPVKRGEFLKRHEVVSGGVISVCVLWLVIL